MIRGAGILVCSATLMSCAPADVKPRPRLGALPFPGAFTLYAPADIGDLGPHRYLGALERPLAQGEGARGIVYTCRAGFLDLAHLRESVDWTWWLHGHAHRLIRAGGGRFAFENDQTRFELIIREPRGLDSLPGSERSAILREAAVRLGQRAAFIVETWHEVESWYGLRTVFFIPEDRSAFTWDDTASHAVGIRIGALVVAGGEGDYDERAAAAIRAELERLGAVPRPWVDRAAQAMSRRWWSGETPLKRDLETGLTTGFTNPWTVPDLECCEGIAPSPLQVPSLRDVRGHDLRGMYEIRLTLSRPLASRIYPGRPPPVTIDAEHELPVLIERLRVEMKAAFGENVDTP